MIDKELLELAAKAAGILFSGFYDNSNGLHIFYTDSERKTMGICEEDRWYWNPLTDDGDAQRLSVKLELCVSHWPRHEPPDVMVGYILSKDKGSNIIVDYSTDPYAATRRAIVMAAIEIGKAMP